MMVKYPLIYYKYILRYGRAVFQFIFFDVMNRVSYVFRRINTHLFVAIYNKYASFRIKLLVKNFL